MEDKKNHLLEDDKHSLPSVNFMETLVWVSGTEAEEK